MKKQAILALTIVLLLQTRVQSEKVTISNWRPPFLDIYPNSLMKFPFDQEIISAGNNLQVTIKADSSQALSKSKIVQGSDVNIVFHDKIPANV